MTLLKDWHNSVLGFSGDFGVKIQIFVGFFAVQLWTGKGLSLSVLLTLMGSSGGPYYSALSRSTHVAPIVLEWLTHSKKVLTSKSSRFPNCQLPHRCLNSSDDVQFWFCHDVVVFFVYHTSVFLRCSNSSPIYQKIWKIHYKLFLFFYLRYLKSFFDLRGKSS